MLGAALVAVWLLLWDSVTVGQVLAGIAVAVGMIWLLPSQHASDDRDLVVRPLSVARLLAWFAWQFVVSNADVVRAVLFPGRWVTPDVVRVPLRTGSPTITALVSNITALTPGLQPVASSVDDPPWLEVHVLSLTDPQAVCDLVQRLEHLVARAFYREPVGLDDPDLSQGGTS